MIKFFRMWRLVVFLYWSQNFVAKDDYISSIYSKQIGLDKKDIIYVYSIKHNILSPLRLYYFFKNKLSPKRLRSSRDVWDEISKIDNSKISKRDKKWGIISAELMRKAHSEGYVDISKTNTPSGELDIVKLTSKGEDFVNFSDMLAEFVRRYGVFGGMITTLISFISGSAAVLIFRQVAQKIFEFFN